MSGNVFLQIFLFVDVFIVGVLTTTAIRHARAHFRPDINQPEKSVGTSDVKVELPNSTKERLVKESEAKYEEILTQGTHQLQSDLKTTSEQINNLVRSLSTEIISSELERYQADLNKLHIQADRDLGSIKQNMDGYQDQIRAKFAQELEAEKQKLISQIDTKLADAVGSFLVETLQHNIDLGNQGPYLISLLEEHKADFAKEVSDET
jgi:F0F1-type ATP synthase membrane subunit b/b'